MTPVVTFYVELVAWVVQGEFWGWRGYLEITWQAAALCLPIMAVRAPTDPIALRT